MEHEETKEIEVFVKISSLKLKEEIEDLYIYQDFIKSEYSIFYNNEIKFPINLEKTFWKKYGKVKSYFDLVTNIKAQFNYEEDLIKLTYTHKNI